MDLIEVPYQTGTLLINMANVRTVFYQNEDGRSRMQINFVAGGEPVSLTGEAADSAWRAMKAAQKPPASA